MAGSINKVTVLGNLGADPEVRMGQDSSKIVTFSVATSEFWNDKQTGERKEKTEWHRIVIFKSIYAKGLRFMLKVNFKPVNGKTTQASIAIQLK